HRGLFRSKKRALGQQRRSRTAGYSSSVVVGGGLRQRPQAG
nr:hypothetical protein [Tanacetum cinerariifolium]